jgi:hypothetical protein
MDGAERLGIAMTEAVHDPSARVVISVLVLVMLLAAPRQTALTRTGATGQNRALG